MNPDKITVDEPFISTDVDHLIRTIADKKKVPLHELRRMCNVDKKNMDKWIAVLEDEGYVSLKYGLGGTYVIWKGLESPPAEAYETEELPAEQTPAYEPDASPPEPEVIIPSPEPEIPEEMVSEEQESTDEHVDEKADRDDGLSIQPEESADEHVDGKPDEDESVQSEESADEEEFKTEMPLEETKEQYNEQDNGISYPRPKKPEKEEEPQPEPDPEELLNHYVTKKASGEEPDIEDIKSNILTNLNDEPDTTEDEAELPEESEDEAEETVFPDEPKDEAGESALPDEPEDEPDTSTGVDIPDPEEAVEEARAEENLPEETSPQIFPAPETGGPQTLVPTESPSRLNAQDVRQMMDDYINEINTEKARIEELKKEKESLYREKFATLEGKMQADIVAFTEKILEKQGKLAQLKEGVLELPDKVDEVEKVQVQMDALKKEGRAALERTRKKANDYITNIESAKEEIGEKISEMNSSIEEQGGRITEIEGLSESLDSRSEKLKEAVASAKAQVDEINGMMSGMLDDLQELEETRIEISDSKDELKGSVSAHGEELQSLLNELDDISRVEHWVQEYVRDYEQKVGEIEEYVTRSEDELSDLREASESLYMKKYLSELENIASVYGGELEDAIHREKRIDQQIAESRARVTDLARESQEMIKKLRDDVSGSKDFTQMLGRVKGRSRRVKAVVGEKAKERERLAEDTGKARKTRTSRKKTKVKAKAKKKKPGRKKKK